MTGDDLGIANVPAPIHTGDIILLEHAEYRVLDVILLDVVVGACPAHSDLRAERPQ